MKDTSASINDKGIDALTGASDDLISLYLPDLEANSDIENQAIDADEKQAKNDDYYNAMP
jgi:hypothetical protein